MGTYIGSLFGEAIRPDYVSWLSVDEQPLFSLPGDGPDLIDGKGGGNDSLDGGTGADTMYGGAGNDRYRVDDSFDLTFEDGEDGGFDIVYTSVSYGLGA